jgi:hypothetical protein
MLLFPQIRQVAGFGEAAQASVGRGGSSVTNIAVKKKSNHKMTRADCAIAYLRAKRDKRCVESRKQVDFVNNYSKLINE